jgi:hypothetical protein
LPPLAGLERPERRYHLSQPAAALDPNLFSHARGASVPRGKARQ